MADAVVRGAKGAGPFAPNPRLRVRAKGGILSRSKMEPTIDLSRTITRSSIISPMVMREFQHRVANTLTILGASIRLELATFNTPGLEEASRRLEKHIIAVGDLHRFFGRHSEVL